MTQYRTTRPLATGQIRTGAARSEGRAPSHDGEYLYVVADPASGGWLAQDNGGVAATSLGDNFAASNAYPGDPEAEALSAAFDAEADAIARSEPDLPAGSVLHAGAALCAAAVEMGWAVAVED